MTKPSPWRFVVFYFDENDPRLWVAKRTGLGWTLNFAHRASWLVLGAFMLLGAAVAAVLAHGFRVGP